MSLIEFILHIDVYLNAFVSTYGFWTYLALFLVIFCETGLIVTPFLPGDSLLFAAGSIVALPSNTLNPWLLFLLLLSASILGNQINFLVGRFIGPRVFRLENSFWFNKSYLDRTHHFYEQYGGKTLILARFLPIIRTFAPFVAGVARMKPLLFLHYNLLGAVLWIGGLYAMGYFLGSLDFIRNHFPLVIYSIIGISLLPPILQFALKKKNVTLN